MINMWTQTSRLNSCVVFKPQAVVVAPKNGTTCDITNKIIFVANVYTDPNSRIIVRFRSLLDITLQHGSKTIRYDGRRDI